MKITVTQADNDSASNSVEIRFDDSPAVRLGRGESITHKTSADRCEVEAVCGVYRKTMVIGYDASLVVRWASSPPDMILERAKK